MNKLSLLLLLNHSNIIKCQYCKIFTLSCSIFTNRFTTRVRRDSEICVHDFIQLHMY